MDMVKMENVRNHWHRFGKCHLSTLQMVKRGAGKGRDFRLKVLQEERGEGS